MSKLITFDLLRKFFMELFNIVKKFDPKINEVWIEPTEVSFFNGLERQQINEFLDTINSVSIEKGNYAEYIVVRKIPFIIEAIKLLDIDINQLSLLISFNGFESLIAEILKLNNYKALKNFRFSDKSNLKNNTSQKRYEIDIIAVQNNNMLLIDAKQWKRKDSFSAMNKAGDLQVERANALVHNPEIINTLLKELGMRKIAEKMILIPFMVSLEQNFIRINDNNVPLVSIFQLNSFLQDLFLNISNYKTIHYQLNLI